VLYELYNHTDNHSKAGGGAYLKSIIAPLSPLSPENINPINFFFFLLYGVFFMSFAIAKLRQSASALLVVLAALFVAAPNFVLAQGNAQSEVGGESRDFRSRASGRWVDLTTWQVYRSGVWINSNVAVGIPNAATNAFIETNHTIIATRANVGIGGTILYNGSQAWAFLEVNDLHINTAASVTTTWGSVRGGFRYAYALAAGGSVNSNANGIFDSFQSAFAAGAADAAALDDDAITAGIQPRVFVQDTYDGDRFGGRISTALQSVQGSLLNRIGNQDIYMGINGTSINNGQLNIAPVRPIDLEPAGGNVPTARNMELRVYGKLRYYAGAAENRTDRDANIQVTAATIGTGSTIVFRGRTRNITVANEWSTTLATQTGFFDNTAFVGGATAPNLESAGSLGLGATSAFRLNNFRGLMGRNSFWTAIFDLGRVVDRNFSTDLFTGPNDDPSTAVGTLQGSFTAGIIQVRRGTLRFEGEALLANEGPATSGSIQIMNNAILQMAGNGNIGRTAVPLQNFGNAYTGNTQFSAWGTSTFSFLAPAVPVTPAGITNIFVSTPIGVEYAVTSRMRYFVVEEGGALDYQGIVGTLSANDVRFNGTVIYSRTGDQTLVGDSPFLSFNPNGPGITFGGASSYNAGENGLFDPFNNNSNGRVANITGEPNSGTISVSGTAPAALGVGTAGLFQPSTTAAYSHLVFRGSGTKFLIATTVTISRAFIFQGQARTGLQQVSGDGRPVVFNAAGDNASAFLPYYLQQPYGGELGIRNAANEYVATKAGFFPALVYLRGTGLTGLRQENNIGTTVRGGLAFNAAVTTVDADTDPTTGAIAQPMWSVYGGNTDPVAFVGFTTASTRPFFTAATNLVAGTGVPSANDDLYTLYPEGQSYPIGMVLSASLNREQMDMSPWNKPAVVHGLPAEPSYYQIGTQTAGIGAGARAVLYTGSFLTQTLGAEGAAANLGSPRFGAPIRQTVDRVNGTGGATNGILLAPTSLGLNSNGAIANNSNFVPGFPVITNSLYDYNINTTATTTLQYDSEASDIMSQIEFPSGVTAPHSLVMNCASNVTQTLPIRTADYRSALTAGINWNLSGALPPSLNFKTFQGQTSTLSGATAGTVILGPDHVNSTNANLPRHAFDPATGLYQASAIYAQNGIGSQITPGVSASAYLDTRPDVANPRNLLANDQYTSGIGLRPTVTLTGTFDGRVRAAFPVLRVAGPTVGGASQTSYPTTSPNDFGRRGDFNNFGLLELRRGNLVIPTRDIPSSIFDINTGAAATFNYTFVLSSTAIVSPDQANVTYGTAVSGSSSRVGANNANAQVVLSEATGADAYPSFTAWSAVGVRNAAANPGVTTPAVLRGSAGPANLAGTLVGGSLSNMLFTGGTGGTISGAALATSRANSGNYLAGSSAYPASYGATDNNNTGNTELSVGLGIIGLQTVAPAFNAISPFAVASSPLAGSTNRYNAGPEMTSDADQSLVTVTYTDGVSARVSTATNPFSGNNQVFPARTPGAAGFAPTGSNSSSYNAGIVRANNAWNVDLPYVRSGLQHVTWLRATSNVMTLVGNADNTGNGLTTFAPETSGLQIYGTIATARGDIDLNGRNIELGGNNSLLVEAFERSIYVGTPSSTAGALPDSTSGNPLWTANQVGMPRLFNGVNGHVTYPYRTGDPIPVFPSRPSSVINNHRSVRAYIGLTSHRNVAAMNQGLGIDQVNEEPAGLGAQIYQTGNPAQFRVRRWQTRGQGLNGALTTRPGVRTADRYWQVETTGTLNIPMGRSEIRLQYIDTDLLNENGTSAGLPPASLNIFRAQGRPYIDPNSPFLGPFQALFAQQLVGPDSYNFVKQLTVTGPQQTVNGQVVLNTGNFAEGDPNAGFSPDRTNPSPDRGFQIWAIGIPAPICLVLRGQRFGGSFGDPIGSGSGFTAAAGTDPGGYQIPNFPNQFGSTQFGGGISVATANNYGPLIGPFKAGVPTVATIVADLLDEFGNVATTNFSTGASLVVGTLSPWGVPAPALSVGANPAALGVSGESAATNAYGVVAGNSGLSANATTGAPVGGRFEWTGVRLDGIASTTVTFSLRNDFVGGPYGALDAQIVAANGGSRSTPVANAASAITFCNNGPAVQVSLQGGFPFSVTFATQNSNASGAANIYPGAQGPYATPGRVGAIPGVGAVCGVTGGYDGSLTDIVVGTTVAFPYSDPGYNSIAVLVRDRFNNLASFSTEATIGIAGGNPPVDQVRTPIIGNVATSVVTWGLGNQGREYSGVPSSGTPGIARVVADLNQASLGTSIPTGLPPLSGTTVNNNNASRVSPAIGATGVGYPPTNNPQIFNNVATFPNFQVLGATSANASLIVGLRNGDPYIPGPSAGVPGIAVGTASPGNTSAIVCLRPGAAVGIAPVLIPDIYNRNLPDRMPSRMYIGRSNNGDPRTWFYVQAVDQFGNRVDNGQNAYNGGTANITFYTPAQGLPRAAGATANGQFPPNGFQFTASNDPYVKANNQAYAATGTSAPAAFGLYTFSNFTPTGPASIDPLGKDVVLTFEDVNLPGIKFPISTGVARPLFQPIPPVTTATTTFLPVPRVSFAIPDAGQEGAPANGAQRLTANSLLLRERARTFLSGNNALESGSVRVQRPTTAASNDIAVGYTLRYFNVDSTVRSLATAVNITGARTFELPNVGAGSPIGLPAPVVVPAPFTSPTFTPALPTPIPTVINGLQGDLSPNTTPVGRPQQVVNVASEATPGTFFLDAGVTQQLVNFRARYSDQVWPRNPGIQGLRAVVMALRNPDSQNATIYEVERTGGVDTALVLLLDPAPAPPVITNAIQDKILARPRGTVATDDKIELDSPQWRPDNIPGFVFYDDNYDPMTYSVTAEDATQVSARVTQSDAMFAGRPALFYSVQPGADTSKPWRITVRAFDGTTQDDGQRRLATDEFLVYVRGNVTSVANAGEIGLTVSPNPAVENVTVQATAKQSGVVRIVVTNALGQSVVAPVDVNAVVGNVYRQDINVSNLANGTYFVQVIEGGRTFTQKVTKF
jgi:hypothetical protein